MKKILLIGVNARYTHSCLALYCLKSYARGADADLIIREYSINKNAGDIVSDIAATRPDAVAFSAYIWNVGIVKKILSDLPDRVPGCVIIMGGPEVSYNPHRWLEEFPRIDCIITGHGEAGFRFLLDNELRRGEKIISIPNPPFGQMPLPYAGEDMAGLKNRYVYYESSRGCPFRCSYCLSSRGDQRWEAKPPEDVMRELSFILGYRPRIVKFVDRTFNMNREHSRWIWNYLLDNHRDAGTTFHFEIHPALLDDDDFTVLGRCPKGLFQFEIGVQSTNARTLEAVHRSGNWERARSAIGRLIELGSIHVHLDLIAGLPFDDMTSIIRAFNELYSLRPGHLQLGFLKVLPGTEMMERAAEFGITHSKNAPYQVQETRWLAAGEMRTLERIAFLVDRLYNTGRFKALLAAVENAYATPFDMFRAFADILGSYSGALTRSLESGAGFITHAIENYFPEKKGFLLEALRQDWQRKAECPHPPAPLRRGSAQASPIKKCKKEKGENK